MGRVQRPIDNWDFSQSVKLFDNGPFQVIEPVATNLKSNVNRLLWGTPFGRTQFGLACYYKIEEPYKWTIFTGEPDSGRLQLFIKAAHAAGLRAQPRHYND